MRLRRNCTSHKRTTHRALRLAFAMALVGGPSSASAVEELPPPFTAPLNHPDHTEAGLLPYPFEQPYRASQAERTEKAQRLVRLVGLQHGSPTAVQCANASQLAQPTPPCSEQPSIELGPMTPSVVAASATIAKEVLPSSETSNAPGQPKAARLPQFPQAPGTLQSPTLPESSGKPAASDVEPLGDLLSESLIDIEIPMVAAQGASTSPSSSTATGSAELAGQPLPLTGAPVPACNSDTGLVKPIQPLQLLSMASESTSIAKPITSSPSVSLSFSDSPVAASTSSHAAVASHMSAGAPSVGDRSASFHLSSASQTSLTISPTAIQLPQRTPGMQVRVEGEPAPLMAARVVRESDHPLPVAPRPSMESIPRIAKEVLAEQPFLEKKVKASFASRTTQLPDHEPVVIAETHGPKVRPQAETLSVGLQEAQALSTESTITELSVEHPTICQLVKTGENSVSLIGMRPGSTRIALITVKDGERQVEVHEVSVGASAAAELSLPDLAKEISRKVAQAVPHSDIEIVAYTDYLLVHGFTPYESDAKKIMSLVRKTSLVPVVDQVKTNER